MPSTIGVERATNPFIRHTSPTLRASVTEQLKGAVLDSPAQTFAATRALKDTKAYREHGDEALPL